MIDASLGPLRAELNRVAYLADDGLAVSLFLAMRLGRPLLLEGEPGVGKTAAGRSLAASLHTPLIRLRCYEGITAPEALYTWNEHQQLLAIRSAEASGRQLDRGDLLAPEFLIEGPLLQAVRHADEVPAVLLIDEIDRVDARFEATLVEFLDRSAVTVPELGTFVAKAPPIVVITSDHSRQMSDALMRHCHYHWLEYPSVERAAEIIGRRVSGAAQPLVRSAAAFVSVVRALELDKPPGLAETIEWVTALSALGVAELDRDLGRATVGSIAKTPADVATIGSALGDLPGSP